MKRTVAHQPVGFMLEVTRDGTFRDIPGQIDIAVAGDAANVALQELLTGETLSTRGTVPSETITSQIVWNPAAPTIKALIAQKYNGQPLTFRLSTPKPFYVYKAVAASKFVSGDRDATTGLSEVTFSGGTDNQPYLGTGTVRGVVGEGHYFVHEADKGYPILTVPDDDKVEIEVAATYSKVTSASDYLGIVMPQLQNTFQATVTNVGNFTAAATGETVTDSLELSAVSTIGEGYVVNYTVT